MPTPAFDIDDAKSFDANLQNFFEALEADDPALAAVLKFELPKLLSCETDKTELRVPRSNYAPGPLSPQACRALGGPG
jgi:hypothetical protein